MVQITASMVKDLRARTGAGMMDCKKALTESDGDIEAAIDGLRKAGLAKAAKKSGRSSTEGLMAAVVRDQVAVLVELLSETDFVAKTKPFQDHSRELAARVADEYSDYGDLSEAVAAAEKDRLGELVLVVGENIQVGRVVRLEPQGKVGSYVHHDGKIGVLIDVEGEPTDEYLRQLGMQVAAQSPLYLAPDDIPAADVQREKDIAAAQPDLASKPPEILEKILEGKLRKWYEDVCLVKQAWLFDDKLSVEKVAPKVRILSFVRWRIGESQ